MFTKIYEATKKFIKENIREIIIYIIVLFICLYPLPYYIYIGGGTIDLDSRIVLDSNEAGSYNLAYVSQINATIPTYLLSYIIPKWDLSSISNSTIDETENTDDVWERDRLYLEEANSNAIINAYKLAKKEINIKNIEYKIIYVSDRSDTNIKIGDSLISVDGISLSNNKEYKEYLNTLNIGEKVNVKVKRNNKELDCYAKVIELDEKKVIGVYLVTIYDYEVNPSIKLNFKGNESGPSGGFMLSLAIYDRLVLEDLTKGRKIVGTGTIDVDGNVGAIGGVKYKLMGAVSDKADIFFVPVDNYEEAINEKVKYDYKIKIISIPKLEDAIDYLKK